MKNIIKKLFLIMFLIICLTQPIYAKGLDSKEIINTIDFEKRIDDFIKEAIEKYHVPATTIVIVKGSDILIKKGFGVSNLKSKKLVDPDKTVFRIGSLSKLITATAAMQLVQQGKIDLNEDINSYIDHFKINSDYDQPVTMAHLLTHTGGFDENIIDLSQADLAEPPSLEDYLKRRMPPVIRKPGEMNQYSNHGMALVGYIIEEVSGMPFDEYVENNIIKPLEMTSSDFNVSQDILNNMVSSYEFTGDSYEEIDLYNINASPAGAFNTTAHDMANFLIAHLQNGKYKNIRILEEEYAIKMHEKQYSNHSDILGMTYGFRENIRNGYRVIEHGGFIPPFTSYISLLPEEKLGIFISTNSSSGKELITSFMEFFYGEIITEKQSDNNIKALTTFETDAKQFEGIYKTLQVPKKSISLYYDSIEICSIKNNNLVVKDGEHQETYVRVKEDLFRSITSNSYIAFKINSEGKIYLSFSPDVLKTYEKMSNQEKTYDDFVYFTLFFALLISIIVCISWVICSIRRKKLSHIVRSYWRKLLIRINCLLILLFVIELFVYMSQITIRQDLEINSLLIMILCLGIIITIITGILVYFVIQSWITKNGLLRHRIWNTIIALASIGFILFIENVNLLGFKF